jgi:hypothetical protein
MNQQIKHVCFWFWMDEKFLTLTRINRNRTNTTQETAKSMRAKTFVDKDQAIVDKLSTRVWSLSTRISVLVDKT